MILAEQLLMADDAALITLLGFVRDRVILVGSRGRGTHRPDSDFDLHIIDMMETEETYDAITGWLDTKGVQYGQDKWGSGSIVVSKQPGFPVPVEFGFWQGTPESTKKVLFYGVELNVA